MEIQSLKKRVRYLLSFFIVALVVSGITAVPLKWEIDFLQSAMGRGTWVVSLFPALGDWIAFVHQGITETEQRFQLIAYGTDWLAFGHIVIAIAFGGTWRDPGKNIWIVEFGMIACVLVIPTALIFGEIRGIPLWWRLLDCSFGIFGLIPLWISRSDIRRIIALESGVKQ